MVFDVVPAADAGIAPSSVTPAMSIADVAPRANNLVQGEHIVRALTGSWVRFSISSPTFRINS
jgi:hypothetical protein